MKQFRDLFQEITVSSWPSDLTVMFGALGAVTHVSFKMETWTQTFRGQAVSGVTLGSLPVEHIECNLICIYIPKGTNM
jgi:hypothetical protein